MNKLRMYVLMLELQIHHIVLQTRRAIYKRIHHEEPSPALWLTWMWRPRLRRLTLRLSRRS